MDLDCLTAREERNDEYHVNSTHHTPHTKTMCGEREQRRGSVECQVFQSVSMTTSRRKNEPNQTLFLACSVSAHIADIRTTRRAPIPLHREGISTSFAPVSFLSAARLLSWVCVGLRPNLCYPTPVLLYSIAFHGTIKL